MNLKQNEKQSGYDMEELYFEKLNRELINKLKAEHENKQKSEPGSSHDNVIPLFQTTRDEKKAA